MKKTVNALEDIFSNICASSYPYEWDENHITFQLMKKLRELFSNRIIHFNNWSKIVDWHSFKNRGTQESSYGDIALIVNVQFSSGETLKGIACIEAKRDYQSGNFEAIDLTQLVRIIQNVPYSHLLFYNHKKQTFQQKFPDEEVWNSNLWISPINTAVQMIKQTPQYDKRLLRTSLPFTMFLTSRIFWGFDLDFREELYNDIANGENKIINPSYLGVVNVYYGHQSPININLSSLWEAI